METGWLPLAIQCAIWGSSQHLSGALAQLRRVDKQLQNTMRQSSWVWPEEQQSGLTGKLGLEGSAKYRCASACCCTAAWLGWTPFLPGLSPNSVQ